MMRRITESSSNSRATSAGMAPAPTSSAVPSRSESRVGRSITRLMAALGRGRRRVAPGVGRVIRESRSVTREAIAAGRDSGMLPAVSKDRLSGTPSSRIEANVKERRSPALIGTDPPPFDEGADRGSGHSHRFARSVMTERQACACSVAMRAMRVETPSSSSMTNTSRVDSDRRRRRWASMGSTAIAACLAARLV